MTQTIDVKGVGPLDFPDDMTDAQIHEAIQKNLPSLMSASNIAADVTPVDDSKQEKLKQIRDLVGADRTPLDTLKNVATGLGNAGQNISNFIARHLPESLKAPESMRIIPPGMDMEKFTGVNDKNRQPVVQSLSQYAPLIAAGPMGLLADTAAGTAYGATQSPSNEALGAGIGGASNAGFGLLNKVIGSSNPMVSAVARSLMGGVVGGTVGGLPGAATGAAAGLAAPTVMTKLGYGYRQPGMELLKNIQPSEVAPRAKAALDIGTPLSPGEAAGRPDITAQEASLGRVGDAAADRVQIGKQRILQQKQAIQDLYTKISPDNKIVSFDVRKAAQDSIKKMVSERDDAVNDLYRAAHNQQIDSVKLNKLENSDPTITNAINDAMADPKYQAEGELFGHPRNSIKVLDYAKRNIDKQIADNMGTIISPGDVDAVRVLTQSKNRLLKAIDSASPEYKLARETYSDLSKPIEQVRNSQIGIIADLKDTQLKTLSKKIFDPAETDINTLRQMKETIQSQNPGSWDTIVRNEMQRIMSSGKNRGGTGANFFDKVLSNDARFNQFDVSLEHNPVAQTHLRNMKTAWQDLITLETPKTASGQSKSGVNKARNIMDGLIDQWHEMVGGKRQADALKYIYSPKWTKDFEEISRIKNRNAKITLLSTKLAKTIAPISFLDNPQGS